MSLTNLVLNNQDLFDNVSRVISKDATISHFSSNSPNLPSGITLKEICFSYYISSGIILLDYDAPDDVEVEYSPNTTTTFIVNNEFLRINFSNPILIDNSVADYNLHWIEHNFNTSVTKWNYDLSLSFFADKVKKSINEKINNLIISIRKGTGLNKKGFRPFLNLEKLMQTISKAIENFLNVEDPPNTPEDEKNKAPEVLLTSFIRPCFSVSFSLKNEFIYYSDSKEKSNYIKILSIQNIDSQLILKGNLDKLVNFYKNLVRVPIYLEQLKITGIPLSVYYKKELILKISEVTLFFGGKVVINKFQLFGLAASLEQTESLIRSILATIVLSQDIKKYPYSAYSSSIIHSANPKAKLINGFVETSLSSMVETALTDIVKTNIELIPGLDLKSFLGK